MKQGGSIKQLADRLFRVRGMESDPELLRTKLPRKLFVPKDNPPKEISGTSGISGGREYKKRKQGPLQPGLSRRPGQKSLPQYQIQKHRPQKAPKRDHFGIIL